MTTARRLRFKGGGATGGVVCPSTLQAGIDAASAGGTLTLTGCIFSAPATVTKSLNIVGGTLTVGAGVTALTIAANNVTVNGMTIRGAQSQDLVTSEIGILVSSTRSDLTIKNCTISAFGFGGIWLDRVSDALQIDHNDIDDIFYAGIMGCSLSNAVIEYNDISSIGVGWTTGGDGGGFDANNAYGIALTQSNSPTIKTHTTTVRYNRIANVPVWHALDTHSGIDIVFTANTVASTSRPVFITNSSGEPTRVSVTNNTIISPSPATYNLVAITLYDTVDCTITGNAISNLYPDQGQYVPAGDDRVYDYLLASTGLTVSDNTLIT